MSETGPVADGSDAQRGLRLPSRGLARRRHRLVRLALLTLGWILLTIGFIGGLLPVLQGWPFGVAGAVILYVESRWFQRLVRRWRQKHPRVERTWKKVRVWRRDRKRARTAATTRTAAKYADGPHQDSPRVP